MGAGPLLDDYGRAGAAVEPLIGIGDGAHDDADDVEADADALDGAERADLLGGGQRPIKGSARLRLHNLLGCPYSLI